MSQDTFEGSPSAFCIHSPTIVNWHIVPEGADPTPPSAASPWRYALAFGKK
jgi:hypothetical protein